MNHKKATLKNSSVAFLAGLVLILTGCANEEDGTGENKSSAPSVEQPAKEGEKPQGALALHEGWAKAAENGMSAAFGEITNSSDKELNIVSATSSAATAIELHEVVEDADGKMVMQEKKGGFVIPASGKITLQPGADHLMFIGLTNPLIAGEEVTIELVTADDEKFSFIFPVKDYTGANEEYHGGDHGSDHGGDGDHGDDGHDHGDH